MAKPQHLPSLFGCAGGFGLAGSGVGSLIGTFLSESLVPEIPGYPQSAGSPMLGAVFGMYTGFAAGAAVGLAYAILVRRSRLRRCVVPSPNQPAS